MTRHTTAPWEWMYGGLYSPAEDLFVLGILGAGDGEEHIEGNEIDKALIAAAPALLVACEAEERHADHKRECAHCSKPRTTDCTLGILMRCEAHRLRKAAIAKAKTTDCASSGSLPQLP